MRIAPYARKVAAAVVSILLAGGPVVGQGRPKENPKEAQKLVERGARAEAQGQLEEALGYYREAIRYAPGDRRILEREAALRSKLVRGYVNRAEENATTDDLIRATDELAKALRLDPSNAILAERMKQIESLKKDPVELRPSYASTGLPELKPEGGKKNFHLRGDTRTVYEQMALAFGIKASFDPDLVSRNVRLEAEQVDFYEAAALVAAQTATFWRPVNPTLLFVAADAPEKRREYGIQAQQTFVLPAAAGPEDMTELLRALRELTGATHIELDTRNHSITIRDSPEKLKMAGGIIEQVERGKGEVLLEFELLEVNRDTARKLGITPPSSARLITPDPNVLKQLTQAKDLSTLTTLLAAIFGGAGAIPQVVALGGGRTTFLLTLPGAAADFSDALSLVESGRRVFMRAQDGKAATFFVGDRFPVTLSLLSSSLGSTPVAGTPTGTLLPHTDYNTGQGPAALVSRDFNGDGFPDVVVANRTDNSLSIFLNQGDSVGTLAATSGSPLVLASTETGPVALAAEALRANSANQDLLVVNFTSNNVSVLLGNGDGTFTAATGSPVAVGQGPSAIVTGDFNGDGNQDFVVTNQTDSTYSVLLGDGTGQFTPLAGSPFAMPSGALGPGSMVSADFNGDGRADLAIANRTTNNVTVLLGRADGTFEEATGSPIPVGALPVGIAAGDLNGDARPDLAVVNQTDETLTVLLNNGDATFIAGNGSPFATGTTPSAVAITDFNVDGNSDIAVTNQGVDSISVYGGLGAGLFTRVGSLPTAAGPNALITADLNSDLFPDAVVTEVTANQLSVILSPTSFLPGGSSVAQQPYPGSEYVDLGVKIKATPSLHQGEVTLQLEFEIRALSGANVNGIPILSNRTLKQTVRVKEEETTLIGGITDAEETRAITGLPGFAEIPGLGYAFGRRDRTVANTELLILVTAREMRSLKRDTKSIYAGRGDAGVHGGAATSAPQ